MKEKTKVRKGIVDSEIGNAYTFLALERTSKLLLAHHVGRRTSADANIFAAKLSAAVSADRFQASTDGFEGYPAAPGGALWRADRLRHADQELLGRGNGLRTAVQPAVHNSHREAGHLRLARRSEGLHEPRRKGQPAREDDVEEVYQAGLIRWSSARLPSRSPP
jgi:hypothetical protein